MGKIKRSKDGMGSMSGLNASDKRVGPVDPNGAWTKVQEATLANARMKATLKRDKELGATKMKNGGRSEMQFGLNKKQAASKEINPASFRKAALKRESEIIEKRSGEMAPRMKSKK